MHVAGGLDEALEGANLPVRGALAHCQLTFEDGDTIRAGVSVRRGCCTGDILDVPLDHIQRTRQLGSIRLELGDRSRTGRQVTLSTGRDDRRRRGSLGQDERGDNTGRRRTLVANRVWHIAAVDPALARLKLLGSVAHPEAHLAFEHHHVHVAAMDMGWRPSPGREAEHHLHHLGLGWRVGSLEAILGEGRRGGLLAQRDRRRQ
jgi:hypothetical protein